MNIVVLAGGLSPERDVSLSSGALIASALSRRGHAVKIIDVYEGICDLPDDITAVFERGKSYSSPVGEAEPDLDAVRRRNGNRDALVGPGVLEVCAAADVVFLGLHGAIGENGQLQATLDCAGIKHYTGTGYAGALLSMDKDLTKQLISRAGVPTADWIYFDTATGKKSDITENVGLPCVVKPTSCGSSVGVTIVRSADELDAALAAAEKYESKLVVEKMIKGRELTVGVLDGKVLPPVEIIPKAGFYDYKNKYQSGMTTELCPAPLTDDETRKVQELAVRTFRALRMEQYGRVDFIYGEDGVFYCLEANALPGMTPTSLLPQEAAAVGIGYDELCDMLADMAKNK